MLAIEEEVDPAIDRVRVPIKPPGVELVIVDTRNHRVAGLVQAFQLSDPSVEEHLVEVHTSRRGRRPTRQLDIYFVVHDRRFIVGRVFVVVIEEGPDRRGYAELPDRLHSYLIGAGSEVLPRCDGASSPHARGLARQVLIDTHDRSGV